MSLTCDIFVLHERKNLKVDRLIIKSVENINVIVNWPLKQSKNVGNIYTITIRNEMNGQIENSI